MRWTMSLLLAVMACGDRKQEQPDADAASHACAPAPLPITCTSTADFEAETTVSTGEVLAVTDLSGDGRSDLVTRSSGGFDVALGHGDGTFGPVMSTSLDGGMEVAGVAVRDLDDDSIEDVAVTAYMPQPGPNHSCTRLTPGRVVVFKGQGNGSFIVSSSLDAGRGLSSIEAKDVDGDGAPDLVFASSGCRNFTADDHNGEFDGGVTILHNGVHDGTPWPSTTISIGGVIGDLALLDLAGDCRPSLAYLRDGMPYMMQGRGDGTFEDEGPFPPGHIFAIADVNEDGLPDVLVQTSDSARLLLGNGDGGFTDASTSVLSRGLLADATGDGHVDLLTRDDGAIAILPGHGDGTFDAPRDVSLGTGGGLSIVADLNGDSRADLIRSDGVSITSRLGTCLP